MPIIAGENRNQERIVLREQDSAVCIGFQPALDGNLLIGILGKRELQLFLSGIVFILHKLNNGSRPDTAQNDTADRHPGNSIQAAEPLQADEGRLVFELQIDAHHEIVVFIVPFFQFGISGHDTKHTVVFRILPIIANIRRIPIFRKGEINPGILRVVQV